jgi:hypothetical protein
MEETAPRRGGCESDLDTPIMESEGENGLPLICIDDVDDESHGEPGRNLLSFIEPLTMSTEIYEYELRAWGGTVRLRHMHPKVRRRPLIPYQL